MTALREHLPGGQGTCISSELLEDEQDRRGTAQGFPPFPAQKDAPRPQIKNRYKEEERERYLEVLSKELCLSIEGDAPILMVPTLSPHISTLL